MQFISTRAHTIIGLVVGTVLLVAPWLFGFADDSGAATVVSLAVGIFIILSELTTTGEMSPLKLVPMRVHIVMDILTGIFLLASPWFFGFNDLEANAWMPHVIVGILVSGYALATRVDDATNSVDSE